MRIRQESTIPSDNLIVETGWKHPGCQKRDLPVGIRTAQGLLSDYHRREPVDIKKQIKNDGLFLAIARDYVVNGHNTFWRYRGNGRYRLGNTGGPSLRHTTVLLFR